MLCSNSSGTLIILKVSWRTLSEATVLYHMDQLLLIFFVLLWITHKCTDGTEYNYMLTGTNGLCFNSVKVSCASEISLTLENFHKCGQVKYSGLHVQAMLNCIKTQMSWVVISPVRLCNVCRSRLTSTSLSCLLKPWSELCF